LLKIRYTRKISALFLLVLISLATTPKQILHHFLTNHTDTSFQVNKDGQARLANAVINCHAQDLVVVAPYIDHSLPEYSTPAVSVKLPYAETVRSIFSLTDIYFGLRGPPAIL
jgi:hypothetical protein